MAAYEVPAATWAIFKCKGPIPTSIQSMQQRIMTEWLPNSGYKYADTPDIEQYTPGDQSSEDYVCYIGVPIQKEAQSLDQKEEESPWRLLFFIWLRFDQPTALPAG